MRFNAFFARPFVHFKIKRAASKALLAASVYAFFCANCCNALCAELFAALGASALENIATVRSLHALTEAMHLAALTFLRLICTNHIRHLSPLEC